MKKASVLLITLLLLILAACKPVSTPTQAPGEATVEATAVTQATEASEVVSTEAPAEVGPLSVITHDSFSISEDVLAKFEEENNVKVSFIKGGDTGQLLNRSILTKDNAAADVLYGIDNTFLSRALEEGIFEPYQSPLLATVPDPFKLDPEGFATPIDFGDVCINYDRLYFNEKGLTPPQTLEDLTKPEFKGLLVVENPATSSPGLAFLLATIAEYGDAFPEYWEKLKANEVVIVNDWETAYYSNFSGSSGRGAQPMVVSYGTSPAAEVIFAEKAMTEAPTASLTGKNMCFRQVEFAGILKGTKNRALAEKFIDYMLDVDFQNDIPMQMFVYPVSENATMPDEFTKYSQAPDQPAELKMEDIVANREKWITAWDEIMLR